MNHKVKAVMTAAVLLLCARGQPVPAAQLPPAASPLAPRGQWLRGDLHVHDDHSADGSLPRQCCNQKGPGNNSIKDQIDFAYASGLEFLPLTDHRTYDQHYDPLWESYKLLLIRGEEANGRPHAVVHGAVDTVVQGANPPGAPGFVNLQQSIWEAHAEDANWGTAHPDDGELDADGAPNASASAIGVDLIEAWNRGSDIDREMAYAESRWNAGYRTGISGASDDHFIELWAFAGPGMPTTWVYAADRRERAVIDALRAGHTTLSADPLAPLLTLEADFDGDGVFEAMVGDEVLVPAGTRGTLRVRIKRGEGTTVAVYKSPGRAAGPIATFKPRALEINASFDLAVVAEDAPAWYRAEARGPGLPSHYDISNVPLSLVPAPQELPDQLRAATSPIFVAPRAVEAQGEIALPADAGVDDGAQPALGDLRRFAGFPDVAAGGGATHVVAEVHDAGASRIWYRRRDGDAWSAPVLLTPYAVAARFPKIAAGGADVWVAWQNEYLDEQPHRPAIYLRHSADGGRSWGAEQPLRAPAGRAEHPALALTADGLPVIAWQEIRAKHAFDVMLQIVGRDPAPVNLSGEGKTVLPALPTDTRSSRYPASLWPAVAVAPDGRIAVAWQDNRTDPDPLWTGQTLSGDGTDPDNWQIMLRLRGAGAVNWSAPVSLGADDRADRHPALAFAADGALTAAWTSKALQSSGANVALLSARSADGEIFGAPAPIAAEPAAMSLWPRLARGGDGRVRAAWQDSRSADWRWRVMTAVQGAGGAWGDVHLIPARGNNAWPALAGDELVFAGTRNAQRLQRDRTQQIFALPLR